MRYKTGDKVFLITDVPHPDGGASVDAGMECVIVFCHDRASMPYLVETAKEQWDPGTGCGDGSEGFRVSTFRADDTMLTSAEHMLEDLIDLRARLDDYEG